MVETLFYRLDPLAKEMEIAEMIRWKWAKWAVLGLVFLALGFILEWLIFSNGFSFPRRHYSALAISWLYIVLLAGGGMLLRSPGHPRILALQDKIDQGSMILGKPLASWILLFMFSGGCSAVLVNILKVGQDNGHAVWFKVILDTPGTVPPNAQIRFGKGHQAAPIFWQPFDTTALAVRYCEADQGPLLIQALETDQGPLDISQIKVASGQTTPEGIVVPQGQGTLVTWPRPSRWIKVRLWGGNLEGEVIWLDQKVPVRLNGKPVEVTLRMPGTFQGWALVPLTSARPLTLEFPDFTHPGIKDVEIIWLANSDAVSQGPGLKGQSQKIRFSEGPGTGIFKLHDVPPVNQFNWGQTLAWWLGLTGIIFFLVWGLAAGWRRWGMWDYPGGNPLPLGRWTLKQAMAAVATVTGIFHLFYALHVPIVGYPDSFQYFDLARDFLEKWSFSCFYIRTPAYPLFLAFLHMLFGETGLMVVVFQHFLLAALGPMTVWALAGRVPLGGAVVAGLLVGISPGIGAAGNYLMTESLFCFFLTATMLFFLRLGNSLPGLVLVGTFCGLATMVRPTGLMLIGILGICLFLRDWFGKAGRSRPIYLTAEVLALCGGYLAVAAPWHLHAAGFRRTLDITFGHTTSTEWISAVCSHRVDSALPICRPHQAIWSVPQAWNWDPYKLVEDHPILEIPIGQPQTSGWLRFFKEWLRQTSRAFPERTAQVFLHSLYYNTFLEWRGDATFYHWPELTTLVNTYYFQAPTQFDPSSWQSKLVFRNLPEQSPVRFLCASLSKWILEQWKWLAWLTLACIIPVTVVARLRFLLPLCLLWIGLIFGHSLIGMPVDRYMVVIEPILYAIVVSTFWVLWTGKWHFARRVE